MKKILLILPIIFLSACTIKKQEEVIESQQNQTSEEQKEQYIDENKVRLGIFLYDNNYKNKHVLEDTYYTDLIKNKDIGSFEIFLTDEKIINGTNFKNTWNNYYSKYENIENIKIGFNIKFILEDGTQYNSNYFEPDTFRYGEYFYTYLYDDIHQKDGAYYSHIENMTEETTITSIKIFASENIDKVGSIILSAFTYDSQDDFDENGNYRGNSLYVIRIKRNS